MNTLNCWTATAHKTHIQLVLRVISTGGQLLLMKRKVKMSVHCVQGKHLSCERSDLALKGSDSIFLLF